LQSDTTKEIIMGLCRNLIWAALAAAGLMSAPMAHAPDAALRKHSVARPKTEKGVANHKIALYVPGTTNGDVPCPQKQSAWTAKALAHFSQLLGGATCIQAQGAWTSDALGLIVEQINIVSAFGSTGALQLHESAIREFALAMKNDMSQEMVSLEWDGALELV
jgi:hypothetical protein